MKKNFLLIVSILVTFTTILSISVFAYSNTKVTKSNKVDYEWSTTNPTLEVTDKESLKKEFVAFNPNDTTPLTDELNEKIQPYHTIYYKEDPKEIDWETKTNLSKNSSDTNLKTKYSNQSQAIRYCLDEANGKNKTTKVIKVQFDRTINCEY